MSGLVVPKCVQVHHDARNGIMAIRQIANDLPIRYSALIIGHLMRVEGALGLCFAAKAKDVANAGDEFVDFE